MEFDRVFLFDYSRYSSYLYTIKCVLEGGGCEQVRKS